MHQFRYFFDLLNHNTSKFLLSHRHLHGKMKCNHWGKKASLVSILSPPVTTTITYTQQTYRLECLSSPSVGYNHLGRVEIILFIGMNIVFWNCQGLRPKRKELQNYLLENQIDILALNETFLKPKFKFHLPGYDIYKNDRLVGTKGGVAILVKKGIIVNQE